MEAGTKEDLIAYLRDVRGLKRKSAEKVVDGMLSEIAGMLMEGRDVRLSRFGIFRVVRTEARSVRTPTGETITVPARRHIRFYPSQTLKIQINPKED